MSAISFLPFMSSPVGLSMLLEETKGYEMGTPVIMEKPKGRITSS
jgi:hypothetical protein